MSRRQSLRSYSKARVVSSASDLSEGEAGARPLRSLYSTGQPSRGELEGIELQDRPPPHNSGRENPDSSPHGHTRRHSGGHQSAESGRAQSPERHTTVIRLHRYQRGIIVVSFLRNQGLAKLYPPVKNFCVQVLLCTSIFVSLNATHVSPTLTTPFCSV